MTAITATTPITINLVTFRVYPELPTLYDERVKHLVIYSAVRLGIFLVALVTLLLIGFDWVWGAVFATGIAFALSVIFLGGMRQRAAESLQRRIAKPTPDADTAHEDAQIAAQTDAE